MSECVCVCVFVQKSLACKDSLIFNSFDKPVAEQKRNLQRPKIIFIRHNLRRINRQILIPLSTMVINWLILSFLNYEWPLA